jgi:peptidoglycan hydrolase-like protein with peptidoglycan-binding domain
MGPIASLPQQAAPPPTAAAPAPQPAPTPLPAEAGMSAADRRQIQEALRRLDYYRGRADGIFGRGTRAAIRRFQQIGAATRGTLTADEANLLVSIP